MQAAPCKKFHYHGLTFSIKMPYKGLAKSPNASTARKNRTRGARFWRNKKGGAPGMRAARHGAS